MAGPTSVSALIHAATMVTAGVYFAGRAGPMFYNIVLQFAANLLLLNCCLDRSIHDFHGSHSSSGFQGTEEAAGLLNCLPDWLHDAWYWGRRSGIAVSSGLSAGIFHLMTHALFKAAAFLAAGAILHAVESRFMGDMGGLRHSMKITFASMLIALLALSGVPPLSGFWSKDAVIAATVLTGQLPLILLAWGTVGLTFFTVSRS